MSCVLFDFMFCLVCLSSYQIVDNFLDLMDSLSLISLAVLLEPSEKRVLA